MYDGQDEEPRKSKVDEMEEETDTKFTCEINGERYYVDKSVQNDLIIVSLQCESSKLYKVWCRNRTHQTAELVTQTFMKFKFFEAVSEDQAGLQVLFKTARSAVDCYRAMVNDDLFPSYNITSKLTETEKKIFFSRLRRQNRLLEPQKCTDIREQKTLERVLRLESQVNFKPKEKSAPVVSKLRLPFLKEGFVFIRYVKPNRAWQNQEAMSRIVKAIVFDFNSLDSVLLSIDMNVKQKHSEIPCIQHLTDLYIDSITEKFTLHDVLVCGLPNHHSQKDVRFLINRYVQDELESVDCYDLASEGFDLQYCIIYVHTLKAAKYLVESLNDKMFFGKVLTVTLMSSFQQRYSILKSQYS